ncbi:MAG TPA: ABC transporter substrate-binding protein [Stellaceae bacterium]|nr:ABC transporter substrate-binding protein [Stellaceae bacterium]
MKQSSYRSLGLGLIGLFCTTAAAAETVKVGMILTLSGPLASLGENIDKGARLYQTLHEAELPAGIKLDIVRRDDTGANPDVAKRLAQELILRDHVQLLTGVVFTPNAAAIAPLTTEAKIPFVLMNATTSNLTRLSPYIVRVSFTQWQLSYTMGEWAAKHGYKRVYVAVTEYSAGIDAEEAFINGFKKAGGEIVGTVRMPQATNDYVPFMERVKDAKPDALYMFTNSGRVSTAAVKGFADAGLRRAGITLLGPGDIVSDEELPNMGDAILGTVTAGHYSAQNPSPQNRAFVQAWKQAYGESTTPNFMAVAGWDGMAAIFSVVKELKGKISGDSAIAVLRQWQNPDSPRGPIAIDPETRDIVQSVYINKVEKLAGGPASVEIEVLKDVKDPWKALHPP